MRHTVAVAAAVALLAGPPGTALAQTGSLKNLLQVCSDPSSSPHDALNACWSAAETGRLDARRRALVWMNAGIAAFSLGRYSDAVTAQGNAIEADPRLAAAYVNRARANDRLDRVTEALSDYAAAISIAPKSADAYLGRGALMLTRGAPERAVPDFTRAIELEPGLASARYNRGLAQLQLGRYREAKDDFSFVIRNDPKEAPAYLNRARARAVLGEPGALADFDKAVELKPEWAVGWYLRGRYLDETGRTEDANASFLRAYQLGHSDPWLIDRVRRISGG